MRPEFHILLIEDSRADVKIIERALAEGNVPHRLTVLHDGRQALDYFDRSNDPDAADDLQPRPRPARPEPPRHRRLPGPHPDQDPPLPPRHPRRRPDHLPPRRGRLQTYQAGANTFIQKPAEYPRYRDLVADPPRLLARDRPPAPHSAPRGSRADSACP